MSNITIVIPVHNRLNYTQDCLKILKEQSKTSFFIRNEISIIIVDDGSTDGTKEWIEKHHPDVIVLVGSGELWYSGSLNKGIRYAFEHLDNDFIMVWETDIYPIDNYFESLQNILQKWDGDTLICSKLYYRIQPEKIFGLGGTFNSRNGKKSLIGRGEEDRPEFEKVLEVDWFLGQGVLIHRSIIEKVGLFDDKNFPQYHADIDYSIRAKNYGYKNIVYPELKLLNDTETTGLSHIKEKTLRQLWESLISIKSNMNFIKDLKFTKIHTTSPTAYYFLLKKYFVYIGSFTKWKVLGWFGIRRKNESLY